MSGVVGHTIQYDLMKIPGHQRSSGVDPPHSVQGQSASTPQVIKQPYLRTDIDTESSIYIGFAIGVDIRYRLSVALPNYCSKFIPCVFVGRENCIGERDGNGHLKSKLTWKMKLLP